MAYSFPSYKRYTIPGGPTYSYLVEPAAPQKPTFLLIHGFPSSSYDWRHQIRDLSKAGYGVIAPDMLGYGGTDKPSDVSQYSVWNMAPHVAKILEHEGIDKVIGVGHDWGSLALAMVANLYPERLSALVFMSVAYSKPGPFDLDAVNNATEQAFGYPTFGYWPFFNESSTASILNQHDKSLTSLAYPSDPTLWLTDFCPFGAAENWITHDKKAPRPSWLTQQELETHISILRKGGYTAPLNWYKAGIRNIDVDKYNQIPAENRVIRQPTLFLVSDKDFATRAEVAVMAAEQGRAEGYLPNVEVQELTDCGHWVQLEKPAEVFEALDGLAKRVGV